MTQILCKNSPQRQIWAVSLCFAAAVMLSLGVLHPSACVFFKMNADEYFAVGVMWAALSTFCGAFILMQAVTDLHAAR